MICKKCKSVLAPDAAYCENCGRRVGKREREKANRADRAPEPLPPEACVPLTTAQCVGILLAFCVPVLNLILMLVWAYAPRGNESRRSMARAGLVLFGVLLALSIAALSVFLLLVHTGQLSFSGVV